MITFRRFLACLSLTTLLLAPAGAFAEDPFAEIISPPALLSAADYGIKEVANELPSERTLRTAVFDLGMNKRAQVSVPPDLFTKAADGSIVFAKSTGEVKDSHFVFDYLAQDTHVFFDLATPSYTLTKGEHSFTLAFPLSSSTLGTVLNDHQISYPLSETATLVWTVDGTNVKKEIHVHNTGTNPTFAFVINSDLIQSLTDNTILLKDASGETFLQTEKPFFMTKNGDPLLTSVSLVETSEGIYSLWV